MTDLQTYIFGIWYDHAKCRARLYRDIIFSAVLIAKKRVH